MAKENFKVSMRGYSNPSISNCHMDNDKNSISFYKVKNSSIQNVSYYVETYTGAIILSASNGNIIQNNIYENHWGVDITVGTDSGNNIIKNSTFTDSPYDPIYAIEIWKSAGEGNKIIKNNIYPPVWSDVHSYWHENYYKPGWLRLHFKVLSLFPIIIRGWPVINIDWHPARHPYDIQWS